MGPSHKSTDKLLKELEEALLRVNELEGLLLTDTRGEEGAGHEEIRQQISYDRFFKDDSFESTHTLDLTSLFAKDVTSSGSFDTKGIRRTVFGRLMEALPIPALLINGSRRVVFANRAWARVIVTYEKVVGKRFSDLFPIDSAAKNLDAAAERAFTSRQVLCKKAVLEIDGLRIWGRLTLRSIRLGPERFLLTLVEDLTAEKKHLLLKQKHQERLTQEILNREEAEQALRESQQRLELAFQGADLYSWDWDVKTGLLVCDSGFAEFLGYRHDEIHPSKKSWEELVHPEDRPGFARSIERHLQGSSSLLEFEYRVHAKAGGWKWILTRGKVSELDQQGRPLRVLGINLDITERRRSEKRIQLLTQAMIQAVERERERISLDLHDEVAQDLASLRLILSTILDSCTDVSPDLRSGVSQASERVRQLIRTVRGISYHLRPAGLDKLGLVSAVSQYSREFSDKNSIRVDFFASGMEELRLDFDTEINLFRIIQESLNNVKQHAKGTKITIRLTAYGGLIDLSIEDDGVGFDVERELTARFTGDKMGLWCMEQRVGILGGRLTIRSSPRRGTRILAEIPYGGDKGGVENKDTVGR